MPPVTPPGNQALAQTLQKLENRVRALETQQQFVVTDPTQATGDPSKGFAVVVLGNLRPYGINAYGLASFLTGKWVQL